MSDAGFRIYFEDSGKPAIVVAIGSDWVVPPTKPREPYPAISAILEKRLPAMTALSARLIQISSQCAISDEQTDETTPYWNNPFFNRVDARAAYAYVRLRNPQRIVEIGSGNSTKFFRRAIADGGLRTHLTSIDPEPQANVSQVADEILHKPVQEVPLDLFRSLSKDDILFFDGSHLTFHGSDVPHFFLRILPEVAPGVLVHVHDISLPDEYPEHFDSRYYNEQYVLAAFLLFNSEWMPALAVHYLYTQGMVYDDGGSFWMERLRP
jgi:hypothetical protein